MENTSCLFCNQAKYSVLYEAMPDLLTGLPGKFRLVVCDECSLVYQHPRPDPVELMIYYPEDFESYIKITPKRYSKFQQSLIDYGLRQRALPILQKYEQGRVLDIGCATGYFLNYLQRHISLNLFGVELNPVAAQFAKEHFQLDVHIGDLHSAQFPDNYFEAVTMWDVIEHLPDPLYTLKEIRRILAPKGLLLFKTPIIDSLDALIFGRYWAGLDMPRHFYIFSRATLKRLLVESGFRLVEFTASSGSFFTFLLSLQFWLQAHGQGTKSNILLKLLRSVPVRVVTMPYFYTIGQLNLGPQVTIVAEIK